MRRYLRRVGQHAESADSPDVADGPVAELVSPEADTSVGALDEAAFDRSVELLNQVGLLSEPVAYSDVVDESVYDAVAQ